MEAKVFEILRSAAKCDQSKLSKTATFEQLGFDSLDSVELVVAMEENMGLDIPNEEAEKISTVEGAINTFYRHLNEKANKTEPKWYTLPINISYFIVLPIMHTIPSIRIILIKHVYLSTRSLSDSTLHMSGSAE